MRQFALTRISTHTWFNVYLSQSRYFAVPWSNQVLLMQGFYSSCTLFLVYYHVPYFETSMTKQNICPDFPFFLDCCAYHIDSSSLCTRTKSYWSEIMSPPNLKRDLDGKTNGEMRNKALVAILDCWWLEPGTEILFLPLQSSVLHYRSVFESWVYLPQAFRHKDCPQLVMMRAAMDQKNPLCNFLVKLLHCVTKL